jgi:flagellar biosynthesis/type III secretory pathway chaperone
MSMNAPAAHDQSSPLETALHDVHTTLADLLIAADEQYAAVVARDHERLERVTRQQERLSARLARAEARRLEILAGASLSTRVHGLPQREAIRLEAVQRSIGSSVVELKARHSRAARLLEQSIEITGQTLSFLHRLVAPAAPAYGAPGAAMPRMSLLLDSRA